MGTAQKAAHPAFAALPIGKRVAVSKTVGETDVYLFAGLSGDFAPLHVDEDYMRGTPYGRRIAHGALMIAYMSRASTAMAVGLTGVGTIVSYGYDRIRFPKPVFIGDTVTVTYEIAEHDPAAGKILSRATCTNQRQEVVAAATHILKIVE
jgi:3-hydroxybutyryl-CoA dehydratase